MAQTGSIAVESNRSWPCLGALLGWLIGRPPSRQLSDGVFAQDNTPSLYLCVAWRFPTDYVAGISWKDVLLALTSSAAVLQQALQMLLPHRGQRMRPMASGLVALRD